MDVNTMLLHLLAGVACGREKTCRNQGKPKIAHDTEKHATHHADSLNNSGSAHHRVEPYPCPYCWSWHVGRQMDTNQLNYLAMRVKHDQFIEEIQKYRQVHTD